MKIHKVIALAGLFGVASSAIAQSNPNPPQQPTRSECNGLSGQDLTNCVNNTPGNRNDPAVRAGKSEGEPRRTTPPPIPSEAVRPPSGPGVPNPPVTGAPR